ncbi:hypothetical protein IE81DRAFT_184508 [Ceraceosorus guamensis]|uniref:Uncharacterized protein n=1 Tax=Ceraceosorus guamensis TaxID=1522189 RepID=A0A316VXS3_9BASI|nr:hypothetical protein IE81DRAFT_184508 [Ceraceosorus guamensis]PWN41203.1 hypothetical protein IE81DRAFT_184508 [Ceraceosorus guamensis]
MHARSPAFTRSQSAMKARWMFMVALHHFNHCPRRCGHQPSVDRNEEKGGKDAASRESAVHVYGTLGSRIGRGPRSPSVLSRSFHDIHDCLACVLVVHRRDERCAERPRDDCLDARRPLVTFSSRFVLTSAYKSMAARSRARDSYDFRAPLALNLPPLNALIGRHTHHSLTSSGYVSITEHLTGCGSDDEWINHMPATLSQSGVRGRGPTKDQGLTCTQRISPTHVPITTLVIATTTLLGAAVHGK